MSTRIRLSRRDFLKTGSGAAGALVLGIWLPGCAPKPTGIAGPGDETDSAEPLAPNAFVRVAPDNTVTVIVNKSEMGQGVYTALPMIVAEELDADWDTVRFESAPAEPAYNHTGFGAYITGGSTSISSSWQQFREAGAAARAMLVAAAAQAWGTSEASLRTADGRVIDDAGGRAATYGELAGRAARLDPPETVTLKDPSEFTLIGRNVKRLEGPSKVTGDALFGMDVDLPDQRTALVARPPVCGGSVASYDDSAALAIPGVEKVKQISSGVAVIARDFWTARRGRDALEVQWNDGGNAQLSSETMRAEYHALLEEPGMVAASHGDVQAQLDSAPKTLEAVYEVPYLAHAPMEPLNCTARVTDETCELWTGTQFQTNDQIVAGRILGRSPESVRVHTQLLGGGFGRRANPTSDFVADAVEVANGEPGPVRTVWTREEDIQCGYYRPMFVHRVSAGLDADGLPVAWNQRLVGQSIATGTAFEQFMVHDGVDEVSVEGAKDMPYAIPNQHIELHSPRGPVTVLWWRSVGHTHTGFVNESFVDEIAHAGGRDPLELRLALLADAPRHRRVLEMVADMSGWGGTPPEGHAYGIAMRKSFNSYVAEVADVSVDERGSIRVHRVWCALDCGIVVNRWNVEAQLQGAVVYGLTAALHGQVTIENGRVQQSNFHDYPVLRMNDTPRIEVGIVASTEAPTGVGEPGVPPIAPAVANAVFTLTGQRLRQLPLRLG